MTVSGRAEGEGIGTDVRDKRGWERCPSRQGRQTQSALVDVPVRAQGDIEQEQGPSPDDCG